MQLAIGIMASVIGGGLAGACVSVFFNRLFHWRELRTKLYPVLSNMYSAYVIRMENPEGRYWTTIVGNIPSPDDSDFVDHRSSFRTVDCRNNKYGRVGAFVAVWQKALLEPYVRRRSPEWTNQFEIVRALKSY